MSFFLPLYSSLILFFKSIHSIQFTFLRTLSSGLFFLILLILVYCKNVLPRFIYLHFLSNLIIFLLLPSSPSSFLLSFISSSFPIATPRLFSILSTQHFL